MSKFNFREKFSREIAEYGAEFRRVIESEVDGFSVSAEASLLRADQAKKNFKFFVQTYFPHYIRGPGSRVHDYLFDTLPKIISDPRGRKVALAAPRGEAKSTLVSMCFVLWCVISDRKHLIVLIMDTYEQAATMMEAAKAELDSNPRLETDFPEAYGPGLIWKEGCIITKNNIKVQAFGSGKRIRGLRHGPHRPDLVVLDDIENDENIRSPAQRDKTEEWLNKAVMKLGPADGSMDVIYIGTILHYDSVLMRTMAKPLWEDRRFQSIIQWPARMDLWDQWEEILHNVNEESADQFYLSNQSVMDHEVIVSWPAQRPILTLMKERADSHYAFDAEHQNDPLSGDDAPFQGSIVFWVDDCPDWQYFGACDPSLGKKGAGRDPSAIIIGGFNRETGVLDIIEASIRKRVPDRIIEDIISFQIEYDCRLWIIETVQFQAMLKDELVKRSAARGVPVPAHGVNTTTDKMMRIESLQPHMANGLIRLHPSLSTLIHQFRHFPKADHDDGPDAVEMMWSKISRSTFMQIRGKARNIGNGRARRNYGGY